MLLLLLIMNSQLVYLILKIHLLITTQITEAVLYPLCKTVRFGNCRKCAWLELPSIQKAKKPLTALPGALVRTMGGFLLPAMGGYASFVSGSLVVMVIALTWLPLFYDFLAEFISFPP